MNGVDAVGVHIIGETLEQPMPEIKTIFSLVRPIPATLFAVAPKWRNRRSRDTSAPFGRYKILAVK
jgi:hypothetical protein